MQKRKKTFTITAASSAFENLLSIRSAHTRRAYRTDVESFTAWKKSLSVPHALYDLLSAGRVDARLSVETFEQYCLCVQMLARNTVNRRISALKSFVSRAFFEGLVDWKLEVETTRALSRADKKGFQKRNMVGQTSVNFEKLVASLTKESKRPETRLAAIRDLAIIHLLENPMLRRSEVSALNVADIDLTPGDGKVYFLGKARSETETLPLPSDGIAAISAWLKVRGGTHSDPLFVGILKAGVCSKRRLLDNGIYYTITKLGRKVFGENSKKVNPSALRRAGITILANYVAKNGVPVEDGMLVTRHKEVQTFWSYVGTKTERKRELVEAVSRHPRPESG